MGRIILNNEEYTGSSGSAPVTDVTVNGSSVVNAQGVAEVITSDRVAKSGDTMSGNLYVDRQDGTTSAEGFSYVILGNDKATGTDKNSTGILDLFGDTGNRVRLYALSPTATRYIGLPDKTGTLALTSDVDTKVSKSGDTMTGTLNIKGVQDGLKIDAQNGTTTSLGYSVLSLGNTIPVGTDKNSTGIIDLYSDSGNKVRLYTESNISTTRYVKLPNATGTLALTSDISSGSCNYANTAGSASYANLLKYRHTNEINFSGGRQANCYFNFRDADTDAQNSLGAINYHFCDYSNTSANSVLHGARFTGKSNTAGTADSATKATQDSDGNAINSTYLKKTGGTITGDLTVQGYLTAGTSIEVEDSINLKYNDSYKVTLYSATLTASRTIFFPNKGGTVAMTSDISSRRYKENIVPISDEEAKKILDVEIVNYDYKENVVDEDERYDQKGAIAEDVVNLIPNAVTYADIDGEQLPDGINYTKFIPYLIKMVQIQQKEIEELKAMIKGE